MKYSYIIILLTALLAFTKGIAQYKTDQIIIQFKTPIQKEIKQLKRLLD